jgi:hypothetical protein
MKRIDSVALKETGFVALVSLILSVFMQSVFLALDYWFPSVWDYSVILGNLLGYIASVGNFFLMCLTVVKAVNKEPKDASNLMRLSQSLRILMLFAVALIAFLIDLKVGCFNIIALVIPYFFPRIAVIIRQLVISIKQKRGGKNE